MALDRIAIDHRIMGGVPCIQGTRIPVCMIVGRLAEGSSRDEILADYPQLAPGDVDAALQFAAAAVDQREMPLLATA
ncbi:DUF433 domain-containing protein [Phytoactinopolyspora mesophila]|uniref:DUF433 domain-containing protein n=1 Tax=Phytoactinopolyspora mesophila TaxID=2650750 RepID=A0A7K3M7F1_9ACTN|nr:DUF433 domain-containing protein [Phytoactinopolyspora mesophila]NDL58338.1 DUF433 domain-containing protein [Phytoactinopolyspora mesophila]